MFNKCVSRCESASPRPVRRACMARCSKVQKIVECNAELPVQRFELAVLSQVSLLPDGGAVGSSSPWHYTTQGCHVALHRARCVACGQASGLTPTSIVWTPPDFVLHALVLSQAQDPSSYQAVPGLNQYHRRSLNTTCLCQHHSPLVRVHFPMQATMLVGISNEMAWDT